MSAFDFVKRHPISLGIGALVIIGGFILLSSGSETVSNDGGPSDASVAAGIQLQQLQYAASAHQSEIAAQRDLSLASLTSAEKLAELEFQGHMADVNAQLQVAGLDYATRRHEIDTTASMHTTETAAQVQISTLQANLQQAQINAETQRNAAQLATIQRQSELNAQQTQAALSTQLAITKETTKCKSLFCKIFG